MDLPVSTAADEYRIEKERIEVAVIMVGGETLHGYVFVQPPAPGHTGSSAPLLLFNDGEPFFPLELPTGEVLLLAKGRVLEVSGLPLPESDELLREAAPMALLEVTLVGGRSHFGSMRLDVRAGRPRLLDYLNESTERFLTLYTDRGVRLLNRSLIERVRPLD